MELIREYLAKIDTLIQQQIALIKRLEDEGSDATEAKQLLAYWSVAYSFFAKRFAVRCSRN